MTAVSLSSRLLLLLSLCEAPACSCVRSGSRARATAPQRMICHHLSTSSSHTRTSSPPPSLPPPRPRRIRPAPGGVGVSTSSLPSLTSPPSKSLSVAPSAFLSHPTRPSHLSGSALSSSSPSPSSSPFPSSLPLDEQKRDLLTKAEATVGFLPLRPLVELLLRRHAKRLSPVEYSRLIALSYKRSRPPHPLTLSVYRSFLSHHSLDSADLSLLQTALHVLSLHRQYSDCLSLWFSLQSGGFPIDATTLGLVLHACDHLNDPLAWRIFRQYQHSPASTIPPALSLRPNPSSSSSTTPLDTAATAEADDSHKRSPIPFVHDLVERDSVSPPTSPFNLLHYTHMISALARTTFAHYVPLIVSHMSHHGVRPDLFLYTRILYVMGTQRMYREQQAIFREMNLRGVMADEKCYFLIIKCLGEVGKWKEALSYIEEMRDRRLRPNEFIYEAVIVACQRAGRLDTAKAITREMHHQAVMMTWPAYASLVQLARTAGEWEWVIHLYHAVKGRKKYREHAVTNDAVIHAAYQLTSRRERGEFSPSAPIIDSLSLSPSDIAKAVEGHIGPLGYWVQVQERIREMEEQGQDSLDPTVREILARATTPVKRGRVGVLGMTQLTRDSLTEEVRPFMYLQLPSHQRLYRLTAPSEPVDHTVAALDLLMQCIYWKAAIEMKGWENAKSVNEEERQWVQRLRDVPALFDSLEIRCHTDVIAEEEEEDEGGVDEEILPQLDIGQLCADSVNRLWFVLTQSFTSPSPSSPPPPEVALDRSTPDEAAEGSAMSTSIPLTPRPKPTTEMNGGRGRDVGKELMEKVWEHLSGSYGMKIDPPQGEGYEWLLTVKSQHLRSWMQGQYEERKRKRRERSRAHNSHTSTYTTTHKNSNSIPTSNDPTTALVATNPSKSDKSLIE